jgi:hypothetical protein
MKTCSAEIENAALLEGAVMARKTQKRSSVDSISDTRLTMATRMGAKTVRFEDTLRVLETTPAWKNTLSPGTQVLVEGKRESNGDITATKITVVK